MNEIPPQPPVGPQGEKRPRHAKAGHWERLSPKTDEEGRLLTDKDKNPIYDRKQGDVEAMDTVYRFVGGEPGRKDTPYYPTHDKKLQRSYPQDDLVIKEGKVWRVLQPGEAHRPGTTVVDDAGTSYEFLRMAEPKDISAYNEAHEVTYKRLYDSAREQGGLMKYTGHDDSEEAQQKRGLQYEIIASSTDEPLRVIVYRMRKDERVGKLREETWDYERFKRMIDDYWWLYTSAPDSEPPVAAPETADQVEAGGLTLEDFNTLRPGDIVYDRSGAKLQVLNVHRSKAGELETIAFESWSRNGNPETPRHLSVETILQNAGFYVRLERASAEPGSDAASASATEAPAVAQVATASSEVTAADKPTQPETRAPEPRFKPGDKVVILDLDGKPSVWGDQIIEGSHVENGQVVYSLKDIEQRFDQHQLISAEEVTHHVEYGIDWSDLADVYNKVSIGDRVEGTSGDVVEIIEKIPDDSPAGGYFRIRITVVGHEPEEQDYKVATLAREIIHYRHRFISRSVRSEAEPESSAAPKPAGVEVASEDEINWNKRKEVFNSVQVGDVIERADGSVIEVIRKNTKSKKAEGGFFTVLIHRHGQPDEKDNMSVKAFTEEAQMPGSRFMTKAERGARVPSSEASTSEKSTSSTEPTHAAAEIDDMSYEGPESPKRPVKRTPVAPASPEERATRAELDKMTAQEKKTLMDTLGDLGFYVQEQKARVFKNAFSVFDRTPGQNPDGTIIKEHKGTVGHYFQTWARTYEQEESKARVARTEKQRGARRNVLTGVGGATGSMVRMARLVYDVVKLGGGFAGNPLRFATQAVMFIGRNAEVLKEARVTTEKALHDRGLDDAKRAADEAWDLYDAAMRELAPGTESERAAYEKRVIALAKQMESVKRVEAAKRGETTQSADVFDYVPTEEDLRDARRMLNAPTLQDLQQTYRERAVHDIAGRLQRHLEKQAARSKEEHAETVVSDPQDKIYGNSYLNEGHVLEGKSVTVSKRKKPEAFTGKDHAMARYAQRTIVKTLQKIQNRAEAIKSGEGSAIEKERELRRLFTKFDSFIRDMDKIVDDAGMIDTLAFVSQRIERGMKHARTALTIESFVMLTAEVWDAVDRLFERTPDMPVRPASGGIDSLNERFPAHGEPDVTPDDSGITRPVPSEPMPDTAPKVTTPDQSGDTTAGESDAAEATPDSTKAAPAETDVEVKEGDPDALIMQLEVRDPAHIESSLQTSLQQQYHIDAAMASEVAKALVQNRASELNSYVEYLHAHPGTRLRLELHLPESDVDHMTDEQALEHISKNAKLSWIPEDAERDADGDATSADTAPTPDASAQAAAVEQHPDKVAEDWMRELREHDEASMLRRTTVTVKPGESIWSSLTRTMEEKYHVRHEDAEKFTRAFWAKHHDELPDLVHPGDTFDVNFSENMTVDDVRHGEGMDLARGVEYHPGHALQDHAEPAAVADASIEQLPEETLVGKPVDMPVDAAEQVTHATSRPASEIMQELNTGGRVTVDSDAADFLQNHPQFRVDPMTGNISYDLNGDGLFAGNEVVYRVGGRLDSVHHVDFRITPDTGLLEVVAVNDAGTLKEVMLLSEDFHGQAAPVAFLENIEPTPRSPIDEVQTTEVVPTQQVAVPERIATKIAEANKQLATMIDQHAAHDRQFVPKFKELYGSMQLDKALNKYLLREQLQQQLGVSKSDAKRMAKSMMYVFKQCREALEKIGERNIGQRTIQQVLDMAGKVMVQERRV